MMAEMCGEEKRRAKQRGNVKGTIDSYHKYTVRSSNLIMTKTS